MQTEDKQRLKGSFTCYGCVHFVNKHREHTGCFGTPMLEIWSDAMQRGVSK